MARPKPTASNTGEATSVPKAKTTYVEPHKEERSAATQAAADQFLGDKPPADIGGE